MEALIPRPHHSKAHIVSCDVRCIPGELQAVDDGILCRADSRQSSGYGKISHRKLSSSRNSRSRSSRRPPKMSSSFFRLCGNGRLT
jgi:hypothetical protein